MGEIADMMLDGTLCEGCGELMDGSEPGHPRRCSGCAPKNPSRMKKGICKCGKKAIAKLSWSFGLNGQIKGSQENADLCQEHFDKSLTRMRDSDRKIKMKIVKLQAENIKRISAVEIEPKGNLVQITGKNGQGKTSVLDSIWWALSGASHIQAAPIRQGETQARIRLDLGEVIVTRTFSKTAESDCATSSLSVENADGARFPSPQRMLDGFLGQLAFDPLAFSRMSGKDRSDVLRQFVPDVDFAAIEAANKCDFDKRTYANRQAKEAQAMADNIIVIGQEPEAEAVSEDTLVKQLAEAGKFNTELEQRRGRREQAKKDIEVLSVRAQEILLLSETKKQEMLEETERVYLASQKEATLIAEKMNGLADKLIKAEALPDPIDVSELQTQIADARAVHEKRVRITAKKQHQENALHAKAESEELTKKIAERNTEKAKKILEAKMPLDGLTMGMDGVVILGGVPFEQASDAEQLRASIAMAMALNPKLRVIRVRDGSLMDEDSLALVAKLAEEKDYQVWVESVDSSGKIGFVMEDGHLKV